MGVTDEVKNAGRVVKGEAKELTGEVVGSDELEAEGEQEVEEAKEDQADEREQRDHEQSEHLGSRSPLMDDVMRRDGR